MEKKQLWIIIAGLIMLNCLTVAFFLSNQNGFGGKGEVVATIGNNKITRQDWLNEMESRYGKDVLRELVDEQVIETMAKKYKITISDKAIDREMLLLKTMYGSSEDDTSGVDEWRQQIKYNMLLEELLTKDVVVSEKEMKDYYEQNREMFEIPTSYHISHIIVKNKKEAEQTIKELKAGSSFSTLAMERSIDEFTANQGGDLGFISEKDDRFSPDYFKVAKGLKKENWSNPFPTEDGYAIILLHEKIKGKAYSFKEVKNQIHRQIALGQMDTAASASAFWDEVNVDWFYGKKEAK